MKITKVIIRNSKHFQAAGLYNFTGYGQIVAHMSADAVHPEITAKLDAIAEHLGIE